MVYRGKPSQGCATCRKRRIRCDLRKDGCLNCERYKVQCPGYRNKLDMLFLHETADVVSKQVKHGSSPPARGPAKKNSTAVVYCTETSLATRAVGTLSRQLGCLSPDDFALSYCSRWHILHPETGSNAKLVVQDPLLLSAMRALGMATFSQREIREETKVLARLYYGDAIRQLGSALRVRERAVQPSALISILCLLTYESICGDDLDSLYTWTRHVEGAAALLEFRGPEHFDTAAGRLLFLQTLLGIISNCGRLSARVPDKICALLPLFLTKVEDQENLYWTLLVYRINLLNLRADAANGRLSDLVEALSTAREIDDRLREAHDYIVFQPTASSLTSVRIYLSSLTNRVDAQAVIYSILSQQHAHSEAVRAEMNQARRTIETLSLEFLANLPRPKDLAVDTVLPNVNLPPGFLEVANLGVADVPVLRSEGWRSLVWQLALHGRESAPDSVVRLGVVEAIKSLGNALGVSHAVKIAQYFEGGYDSPDSKERFGSTPPTSIALDRAHM